MRFFSTEIDGSGWSIFDQNRAGFQEVREPLGGGVRGVSGGSQGGPGGGVPGCSRKGGRQKVFRGCQGPRAVPEGSQGGPRGVPGGSQGVPGGSQRGPGPRGVPGGSQKVSQRSRQNRCRSPPGPQTPPGGTPLTPVKNTKRHQWS